MNQSLTRLKQEIDRSQRAKISVREILMAKGFMAHYTDPIPLARGYACYTLFTEHAKKVYENDLIAGSYFGLLQEPFPVNDAIINKSRQVVANYGWRTFGHNADHFAPDYATFIQDGVGGTLEKIHRSLVRYEGDTEKTVFLQSARVAMEGFREMIAQYANAAAETAETAPAERKEQLLQIEQTCRAIVNDKPQTFRQALQLVWLAHLAFVYEGRYAMALGRLDQYLYPYYQKDVEEGILTRCEAKALMECTLYKIGESHFIGGDDVVNIAIGGVTRDGADAVNELSYIILESVRDCGIPGPNLSARIHSECPDRFLDECLKVIGTGLGYPALMNDEANIPALARNGYAIEDCRDYCMVGCIENFLPGQQPPWSDGRYNSPKYIELALNNGVCMQSGIQMGPATGSAETITSMDDFMARLHLQMQAGADEYVAFFQNENQRYNPKTYTQPFLSCFCQDCIERGLDINNGGAHYPSAHGAGCMGVGTMADSLAAMEQVIFVNKKATIAQLRDALLANFEGYEDLQQELLAAPKYGNNDDRVDRYAVWYVDEHARLFDRYRTWDGGRFYVAIASNIQNISAGALVAATPDGRKNGEPLSDAASPMHGMDQKGPTATVLSTAKPDYTKASCGTVLNQKYSPSMFTHDEKRAKLASLIRVYFKNGGQEMQINSVSREILQDAMEHPQQYPSLVVRVSGFSAYYNALSRDVQEDILRRTEQG